MPPNSDIKGRIDEIIKKQGTYGISSDEEERYKELSVRGILLTENYDQSMSLIINIANTFNYLDGYMELEKEKIKVKDLSDILISRFAFISGLRTNDNHPILTFPDSKSQISFEDYHLLIAYLFKFPP
jgi:hypothetical protein